MSEADYSAMTDTEFDDILDGLVGKMSASAILAVPGVYEAMREELNNEVLEKWEADNPDKAYAPRLVKCKKCGCFINLNFGEDDPIDHSDAEGTEDDPRSPGDSDDICDVCEWGGE